MNFNSELSSNPLYIMNFRTLKIPAIILLKEGRISHISKSFIRALVKLLLSRRVLAVFTKAGQSKLR